MDDDSSVLKQAEIFLEDEDDRLNIETFSSVEEGLELLERSDFDAIVSDYQMPEMSGLEFLRIVREELDSDIPFIILTGKGREEVAMEALNLGADRYLEKKGDPKSQYGVLAKAIVQEVERHKAEKAFEKSEDRYRKLFESAQDGMLIMDAESGEVKAANPCIQDLTGYSEEDLIGRKLWRIGAFRNVVEDKERFEELVGEGFIRYEGLLLEKKDGEEVPVDFVGNTYQAGGEKIVQCNFRNVSEREKREEELRRERKRFLKIFNNANDAIYLHELDEEGMPGNFIEVNDVACEMLGYSREEFLEMSPQDIDSSKKADDVPGVMEELVEEGDARFEMYHQAKDGTEIPVEIHSHVFELEGEKRVLSVARDITERKKAEEKLAREKERAQRYLETAEVMMVGLSPQGEVIQANRKASEVLGYEKEEILGKNWFENFVPEDYKKEILDVHQKLQKNEYPEYYESPVLTKSEDVRTILWHNSILKDGRGNAIGTLSSGMDITERKEAEEKLRESEAKYRELFESIRVGIIVQDSEGGIISVNSTTEEIFGMVEEEIKEKSLDYWEGILYKGNMKPLDFSEFPVSKVFESKKPVEEQVIGKLKGGTGEFKWYVASAVPHLDGEGEVERVIVSFKDITKQKRFKDRKDFLNTLLRQDLTNKYQIIQGYYELLEEEADLSEEYRKYLRKINKASKEADELLGLAKKLEKIEGTEETEKKDIIEILEFVIETVSDLGKVEGVEIEENYSDSISKVKGDYSLYTLFTQLLATRIRIGEAKKIKISVNEKEKDILVRIEDDGKPLPEDIKKLFTKRVYSADTSGIGGVRYYIVGEIARHNNSKIEAKDSELDGASFDIRLQKA